MGRGHKDGMGLSRVNIAAKELVAQVPAKPLAEVEGRTAKTTANQARRRELNTRRDGPALGTARALLDRWSPPRDWLAPPILFARFLFL